MSSAFAEFADVHEELHSVARNLLARTSGRTPSAPADWGLLAASGWLGLEVSEALGGSGATFREVAVILHEMGRAATLSSYLGTVVLGVGALNLTEPGPVRDNLLHEIATGARRVAVGCSTPAFHLKRSSSGFRLEGHAAFVPDAPGADRLLLVATDPDGTDVLVEVTPGCRGLTVAEQPLLDPTRRVGVIAVTDAAGVDVRPTSVLRFRGDPAVTVRRLGNRGAVAVACDSLGLAEAMMEATVAYAGVRRQFGRPIGSFQAVKHACADMLVEVQVGRQLVSAAVESIAGETAEEAAEGTAEDAGVAVSMAKAHVGAAAVDIVGKALQLHGGIGYTWESGIHRYLKRALFNRALFGSPSEHRTRLAGRYRA
jgi:alkylation response protein AidB-like acyl-CoA dehydrogenase